MPKFLSSTVYLTLPLAIFGCLITLTAEAQITPDGTTSTTVNQAGNDFTIEQGSRVGDNLFHSFDEFSVPTLGSAFFNNASDIANVFSRVTGSNISTIDGLLSANGTANFFLINPNGIIFGENARLNLGGSFFASTADSLLFRGNTEFSASNPQAPPLLEVSIPIGINFRDNPGDIVNRSYRINSVYTNFDDFLIGLEVAPGENLTLVGGNINFKLGQATAKGGHIQLGGLSAAGTVGINDDGSLSFPEDVAKADINFSNFANVDVSGTDGGNITINARNLNLDVISTMRAGITADSISPEAQAGDITISATDNITIDNSAIRNQVNSGAEGNGGDINITTGSLNVTNGGQIDAQTFSQGNAGSINIIATDTITFDGEDSSG
ncbi:MAG: filamentous hemagglutinin N-terminal domain-containing protein, partial [Xenococcus sp. (in: cyanobacteria)]